MVRGFGLAICAAAAFAAGAVDARALSCGPAPVVFRGGEYTMVAGSAGVSIGSEAGTAAYPTFSSSDDRCHDDHDVQARWIRGVSPLAGIAFPGWGVFAAGERCTHFRGRRAVECLQVPLRFGSRLYRPVRADRAKQGQEIGLGWIGNDRVRVLRFADIDQRRVIGVVGRPRERYVADSYCRVVLSGDLQACLEDPHVFDLPPLEGSTNWWLVAGLPTFGAALLVGGALAVRRAW